jgi:signal transduction histidine kinase
VNSQQELADLIHRCRAAVIADWAQQVRILPSARNLDTPTLTDHVPWLLDELVTALRIAAELPGDPLLDTGSSMAHGLQRATHAFDIEEVVAEYDILRGCIHALAERHGLAMCGPCFHTFNRVLNAAVGQALRTYVTQRALEVQRRREDYLAFVAHDLRTPLNAIALATKFLSRSLPDVTTPAATRMLQILLRNVEHLEHLVARVIDENSHLRTESGIRLERRELQFWPLVELLLEDLKPVADKAGTRLANEVADDLTVYADAELLRRILQNLLSNAIHFTPRGVVTVTARALPDGSRECTVIDTGAGIAPERIAKIFDKGETDTEGQGGLGLGLAIVKTFVEAHGGSIEVDSVTGSGSRFVFLLPARASPQPPTALDRRDSGHDADSPM